MSLSQESSSDVPSHIHDENANLIETETASTPIHSADESNGIDESETAPKKLDVAASSEPAAKTDPAVKTDPVIAKINRPIGKLPLEISALLGNVFVDAKEAVDLSAGKVLPISSDCPGQVKLVYKDHEIGRGELVDVNGKLGIKITHNWCQ